MMKVIRINKSFRNGNIEHFLVLTSEITNDDIDYSVETWCESESSGKNYGYTYDWEYIDDKEKIKTVLLNEITIINNRIAMLNSKKCEIEKDLE